MAFTGRMANQGSTSTTGLVGRMAIKKEQQPTLTNNDILSLGKGPLKPSVAQEIVNQSPTLSQKFNKVETISAAPKKEWPLGFVGQIAKSVYETTKNTIDNATRKLVDMFDSAGEYNLKDAEKIQEQYGQSIPQGAISTEEAAKKAGVKPVSKLERGVSMVSGASSALDLYFLKYSIPLEAGAKLPGVFALPSKVALSFLDGVSFITSNALDKGVDELPIPQESKDTIKPLVKELGTLVAQLGIAHTGAKIVKGKDLKPGEFPSKSRQATQLGLSYAMNPFSTVSGLVNSRIAIKVAEKQQAGEEITPEVGKQVIEEVKQEIQKEGLPPVEELMKPIEEVKTTEATLDTKKSTIKSIGDVNYEINDKGQIIKVFDSSSEISTAGGNKSAKSTLVDNQAPSFQPSTLPEPSDVSTKRANLTPVSEKASAPSLNKVIDFKSDIDLAHLPADVSIAYNKAFVNSVKLDSFLNDLKTKYLGSDYFIRIKNPTRTIEKMIDGKRMPGDILASTFVSKDPTIFDAVIKDIAKNYKIRSYEDFFKNSNEYGYRGVNIKVVDNGAVYEIQLHTPESRANALELHKLYEQWRNKKISSSEEMAKFKSDLKKSRELFNGRVESSREATVSPKTAPTSDISKEVGKTTKPASDINTELIKQGLEELPKEKLAQYNPTTKAETIQSVAEIMKDSERAKRIATGKEDAKLSEVERQVLFNTLEKKAIKEGDYQTLVELANSPIATERSLAAQTLGSSAWEKDSVVKNIQEAIKVKEANYERKTGKKVDKAKKEMAKDIKEEIKKTQPKVKDWTSFIESIKC